jgi:glycine cleavage system aminomethyltransferase T
MGTAWQYQGDAEQEYLAIRTKAGLMDVSGLKKVHLTGPAASHVIDRATTRSRARRRLRRKPQPTWLRPDVMRSRPSW